MLRRLVLFLLPALALVAAGCTIDIQQTSGAPTSAPVTRTASPSPTVDAGAPIGDAGAPIGDAGAPIDTATSAADPSVTAEETSAAAASPPPSGTPAVVGWHGFAFLDESLLTYEMRTGWEDLGLAGSVLFLSFSEAGQSVVVFDFETGRFAPIFLAPANTWVLSASKRPDVQEVLLSYAPVPPEGEPQYGYTDLYSLRPGGGLTPILERTEAVESFFSAFWSHAGDAIFYSWFVLDESVDYGFRYHVNRLDVEAGASSTLVEDGFWQVVSADDARLAYVTLDPNADAEDPAELRLVPVAGGAPEAVLDSSAFPTVDAPFFSPDGRYLYYSAVSEPPPRLSWLDRLMGVSLARAHNVPSDWWRTDLASGAVEQITDIYDQGMFGDFSPDGAWIAFISSTGLWVMDPDGGRLTQVISSGSFYGNMEWVP